MTPKMTSNSHKPDSPSRRHCLSVFKGLSHVATDQNRGQGLPSGVSSEGFSRLRAAAQRSHYDGVRTVTHPSRPKAPETVATRPYRSVQAARADGFEPVGDGLYRRAHQIWEMRQAEDGEGFMLVRLHEERAVDFRGASKTDTSAEYTERWVREPEEGENDPEDSYGTPSEVDDEALYAKTAQKSPANEVQSEYWDEVESLAQSRFDDYSDQDEDLDSDYVHELVDGHQWIIYTAYNAPILQVASEPDYGSDQGLCDMSGGYSQATLCMAFWAFYNDVAAKVQELRSEGYGQTEDEDEDEDEADEDPQQRIQELQSAYEHGYENPGMSGASAHPDDAGMAEAHNTGKYDAEQHVPMKRVTSVDERGMPVVACVLRRGMRVRTIHRGQVADAMIVMIKPQLEAVDLVFDNGDDEEEYVTDVPEVMLLELMPGMMGDMSGEHPGLELGLESGDASCGHDDPGLDDFITADDLSDDFGVSEVAAPRPFDQSPGDQVVELVGTIDAMDPDIQAPSRADEWAQATRDIDLIQNAVPRVQVLKMALRFNELPVFGGQIQSASAFAPGYHQGMVQVPDRETFVVEGFFFPDQDQALAHMLGIQDPDFSLGLNDQSAERAFANLRILLAPKSHQGTYIVISPNELENYFEASQPSAAQTAPQFDDPLDDILEMPGEPATRAGATLSYRAHRGNFMRALQLAAARVGRRLLAFASDWELVAGRKAEQLFADGVGRRFALNPDEAMAPNVEIYTPRDFVSETGARAPAWQNYEMVNNDFRRGLCRLRPHGGGEDIFVTRDEMDHQFKARPSRLPPPPESPFKENTPEELAAKRKYWEQTEGAGPLIRFDDEPGGVSLDTRLDPARPNVLERTVEQRGRPSKLEPTVEQRGRK